MTEGNVHKRTGPAALAALLMVLVLLISACAPAAAPAAGTGAAEAGSEAAAPAEEAAAGEVGRAETLIFASDTTDLLTLDPAVVYEFSGIQAIGNVYETLVSFEPGETGVQPVLAESWEIVDNGNGSTITFKLNPNATFASGNPVTAEDVVYSWGRAIDINLSPAFLLIDIAKVTKENMRAVDAQTFEVTIPADVSPQVFLSVITFTVAAVVEKAAVEANLGDDLGQSWLNDNSAGSGPYILSSWEREVAVTLDANPGYWGTAPAMQRIILQNVQEAANLQAALETGDADIVQDLGPEQKAALEGNPDAQIVTGLNTQLIYIGMNAKMAPFDNPDVREAVRWAINYDEIIALTGGNAELVQEVIPQGFLGHTGQNPFSQDLDKARQLLEQAGVTTPVEVEALVPTDFPAGPIDFPTLAAKVQADLGQVGINLNLRQVQFSELLNIYREQGAQMVFVLWGPDFPDPDGNATPFTNYEAKSIAWRNAWEAPDIAAIAAEAAVAPTPDERAALYAEMTERVFHEGPYAILYHPLRIYGVRADIQGFAYDPSDTPSVNFAAISRR